MVVGSAPAVVIPLARLLARRGVRCLLAVPPREHWRLHSRAIAAVVHLDGSDADAPSLLRILVESARAELVLPTSDSARRLISQLHGVGSSTHPADGIGPELRDAVRALTASEPSTQTPDGRGRLVPWSWSDPIPTLQDLAYRVLDRLVRSHVVRTVRTAWGLPRGLRWHFLARHLARLVMPQHGAALPPGTRSILFVCHGNRMRSPAAEAFLRAALASTSVADRVWVASAGTHAHGGLPAEERARRVVEELGVALESHRSQPLDPELVGRADAIIAMDDVNVAHVVAEFPDAAARTYLLGELVPLDGDTWPEILDPYLAPEDEVIRTMKRIHAAATQLASMLAVGGDAERRSDG